MIRPVHFGYNAETAVNNAFQVKTPQHDVQEKALAEFDAFVKKLTDQGIDVLVINDTPDPYTPDSIFPNNWISFHEDGSLFLYPMFAANRRLERKPAVIAAIDKKFTVSHTIDLSAHEAAEQYLEGTGSMVLDRNEKIAYACISPRTDLALLHEFCRKTGYRPVSFRSVDADGQDIYHTNVMMCVADRYVVICLDSIPGETDKQNVIASVENSRKKIIPISMDQVNHFAGNMLQVQNKEGDLFLVMSTQAYESLTPEQVHTLESFNPIIHSSLTFIEANGGGSARCMMAEIHLPLKQ